MTNQVQIAVQTTGVDQAVKGLDTVKASGNQADKAISGIGSTARGLLAADFIGQIGSSAMNTFQSATTAASDLSESMNAVDKIFGESADVINEWGETNANAFGLSQRAFNQLVVPLGAGLKNAGIDMANVTKLSLQLTERAADMASVFNTDVATALQAIQAGLRGESDPLEQFGVGLNEAAVAGEAMAMTGKKVATELTMQDKALARVNLIMKQTESTANDFRDTSDGLANSTRIANAQFEEAKAKIGQGLLPILAQVSSVLGTVAQGFSSLPPAVQTTTAVVLGLGAAFIFLAPKVMAARDAVREMNFSFATADTRLGRATQTIAVASGRLAVLTLAAQIAGAALGNTLNPQVEELSENLATFANTGQKGGEAARLLGDDFGKLDTSLKAVASPGTWNDFQRGAARTVESLSGLGTVFDDTFTKDTERVKAFDAALAAMVSTGRAIEAQKNLAEAAQRTGLSVEDLTKALPEYSAAQAKADRATGKTTEAIQGEIVAFDELSDALKAQADPMFRLIDAQNDLAESQRNYTSAVKEFGRNSPEAEQALRNVAEAAINMTDATIGAQGVFQGRLTPAMRAVFQQANLTTAQIAELEQQFKDATAAGNAFAKNYNATVNIRVRGAEGLRNIPITSEFSSGIGGRQSGGYGSGLVMAGEHGKPELVDLGTGGRVYNASETQNIMSGQGGNGQEVTVRLQWDFRNADEKFAQFFKSLVDAEGDGSVEDAFNRRRR